MKKILALTLAALLLTITTGNLWAADASKSIALTLKVTGKVEIRKSGQTAKTTLKFGTPLDDGDWLRTSTDGIVTLIFADDKSQLTLQPNTEVTINGRRDAQSNIAKRVSMEVGQLYAKVAKQRGTLEIATPTSVASVKGTEFWVVVFPDGTTEVITLEGLVALMNRISGEAADVGAGQTGHSGTGGAISVNGTLPEDIPENQGEQGQAEPKTIEIQVTDPEGNPHTIIIQYLESQ
jgi:hypothetical protein